MTSKQHKQIAAKNLRNKPHVAKQLADNPRFNSFADHIVSPGSFPASLAPSLCPSRAGAVTYPLVVDVTGMESFAIVAQPRIDTPLMITHLDTIAESSDVWSGDLDRPFGDEYMEMTALTGCAIESVSRSGRPVIPFYSAAGCTITPVVVLTDSDVPRWRINFYYLSAGSYVDAPVVVVNKNTSTSLANVVLPATVEGVGFTAEPDITVFGTSSEPVGTCGGSFRLNFVAGTATCQTAASSEQGVFDIYQPEWSKVLAVADKICIPYMDALVTYQGSTLNNQGAIAVASCSEELSPVDGNYYSALASRPFDNYEGRLASQGETEGGAHWHLLHDDIRAYSLTYAEDIVTGPRGYFGIRGMDPTQTVRVHVNITLNYYTLDPSFSMVFQPPWGNMDLLLYALRTDVPVCSSNDGHLNKVIRSARKKAKEAGMWALENPEQAAARAMSAMKFIAPLLLA